MNIAFIAGLGPLELAIILLIVLVIVGGRRLPALGRQLGEGVRGFKDSVTSRTDSQWDDDGDRARPRSAVRPARGGAGRRRGDARALLRAPAARYTAVRWPRG